MSVTNNTPKGLCYNCNMGKNHKKAGFTLIELSLAMVFIALLSLAIVLIITSTIASYRKGLTMNLVNSVGSQLVDDLRLAIQNSSASSVANECNVRYADSDSGRDRCVSDGGSYLSMVTKYKNIKINPNDTNAERRPIFGAICTGSYSYVWNSGYMFSDKTPAEYKEFASVKIDGNVYSSSFHMLKLRDEHRRICASQVVAYPANGVAPVINNTFNIMASDMGSEEPQEMLDPTNDLALYDLSLFAPAEANNGANLYFAGSFILGTIRGGPDITTTGGDCRKPNDVGDSDYNYCSINKFNFAAQAGGD